MLESMSMKNRISVLYFRDTFYYSWSLFSPAVTFRIPRDLSYCTYTSGLQGVISSRRSEVDRKECNCLHSARQGSMTYQSETIDWPFLPSLRGGFPPASRLIGLSCSDTGLNSGYEWKIRYIDGPIGLQYIVTTCIVDGDPARDNAQVVALYYKTTEQGDTTISSAYYVDFGSNTPLTFWSESDAYILEHLGSFGASILPEYVSLDQDNAPFIYESLVESIPWRLRRGIGSLFSDSDEIDQCYSRTSEQAALNMDLLPINMLENLTDLFELKALIPPVLTVRDWKKVFRKKTTAAKKLLKLLSKSWLYYLYVVMTSWSDIQEAFHAYLRYQSYVKSVMHGNMTARGYTSATLESCWGDLKLDFHCKLKIKKLDSISDAFLFALRASGLDVTGKRTYWDLVPLSFVLDWITNIGKIAVAEDGQARLASYNIRSCVYSVKTEIDYTPSNDESRFSYLRGTIKEKYYLREVEKSARVSWLPSVEWKLNRSQWLTASALVVALTKFD